MWAIIQFFKIRIRICPILWPALYTM
jgi:hypothetical protein